jgi:hypothetical protein
LEKDIGKGKYDTGITNNGMNKQENKKMDKISQKKG